MRDFRSIDSDDLTQVMGGEATAANLGRCGPGDGMAWLGDVRTPECLRHDQMVRSHLDNGSSKPMAHLKSLPALPSAVGSYIGVRAGQAADAVKGLFK
jgi:hypothetical protein